MSKRCFNTQEAMEYLGLRRRVFYTYIVPALKDKAVKVGTSVVYEKADLDRAWDRYKLVAGSERAKEGSSLWDVQQEVGSIPQAKGHTKSTRRTKGNGFDAVVLSLTKRQRTTS